MGKLACQQPLRAAGHAGTCSAGSSPRHCCSLLTPASQSMGPDSSNWQTASVRCKSACLVPWRALSGLQSQTTRCVCDTFASSSRLPDLCPGAVRICQGYKALSSAPVESIEPRPFRLGCAAGLWAACQGCTPSSSAPTAPRMSTSGRATGAPATPTATTVRATGPTSASPAWHPATLRTSSSR